MSLQKFLRKVSLCFLAVLGLALLWAWAWHPEAAFETNASLALAPPGEGSLLGRDSLGRDLFFRILEGAQISLFVGVSSAFLSFSIGFMYGGASAMAPSPIDGVMMRGAEILLALPSFMLMAILFLLFQSFLGSGGSELLVMALALGVGSWMSTARLTRNLIRLEKKKDYVEAAKALGASPLRIFLKHLLPNISSALLVFWSLQIPHALLAEGLISFLGFGVKSPHVSWGILLQEGWRSLGSYPHLLLAPCLALFLTVFSLNILLKKAPRDF